MATYFGTVINESPTYTFKAGQKLEKAQGIALAIKDGKLVLPEAGANVIGVTPMSENEEIGADNDVNVQIKDIGAWVAGGKIAIGDQLATDAQGHAVKAQTDNFIVGVALTTAEEAGTIVRFQMTKSGKA